jgi:DNA invertase Pin-like site-specific DNA recombinase
LLKGGEASALVVAKLDRLSRSVPDFAAVLATAGKQRWAVVALDLGVDTTTPAGELVAGVMMVIAQWERRIIGVRTREAMAEAKANGARFGRERSATSETVARILHERSQGQSFNAIAAGLDADAIPTPGGGLRWYGSTVTRLHRTECKQREEVA